MYMRLPDGIEWLETSPGNSTETPKCQFLRLNKALYRLRQAPKLWHDEISGFLLSLGLHRSEADGNLYIRSDGILILLYVDDILVLYANESSDKAIDTKNRLMQQYKMSNLGPAKKFLGLKIDRLPDGSITLSQPDYIDSMLQRFNMIDVNTVDTPLHHKTHLDNIPATEREADSALYQSIVGSIMYAALGTRPDIAYAVSVLSRYNSKPYTSHLTAAKRVLRYLKGTADAKLVFPGRASADTPVLIGYTDSDYAMDRADRKSQGGYIFHTNGAPISWQSRKQRLVALSTTEAEYIACSEATREARWLSRLHQQVTGQDDTPLPVHTDSAGALKNITAGTGSAQTKHIDIQYHNSRDLHAREIVKFSYISTDENLADLMTKPLASTKHWHFTTGIGLHTDK
jgi:hypothetical protein